MGTVRISSPPSFWKVWDSRNWEEPYRGRTLVVTALGGLALLAAGTVGIYYGLPLMRRRFFQGRLQPAPVEPPATAAAIRDARIAISHQFTSWEDLHQRLNRLAQPAPNASDTGLLTGRMLGDARDALEQGYLGDLLQHSPQSLWSVDLAGFSVPRGYWPKNTVWENVKVTIRCLERNSDSTLRAGQLDLSVPEQVRLLFESVLF